MFTGAHFIWLALCLIFVTVMSLVSYKMNFSLKTAGLIMTGICLLSETSKIMSNMIDSAAGGKVLDPLCLPFHLCSLMLFGVFFITFGKDETAAKQYIVNFVAVIGTLGSICALLIPTNGTDFTTIDSYQCFVYHAGLLWFSIYLIFSGKAHLNSKALLHNIVIMLLLTLSMIYINSILLVYGTNFMYLVRPPMENLPYLNLERGWYVYFLRLVSLCLSLLGLFHLPFILHEHKEKHN